MGTKLIRLGNRYYPHCSTAWLNTAEEKTHTHTRSQAVCCTVFSCISIVCVFPHSHRHEIQTQNVRGTYYVSNVNWKDCSVEPSCDSRNYTVGVKLNGILLPSVLSSRLIVSVVHSMTMAFWHHSGWIIKCIIGCLWLDCHGNSRLTLEIIWWATGNVNYAITHLSVPAEWIYPVVYFFWQVCREWAPVTQLFTLLSFTRQIFLSKANYKELALSVLFKDKAGIEEWAGSLGWHSILPPSAAVIV